MIAVSAASGALGRLVIEQLLSRLPGGPGSTWPRWPRPWPRVFRPSRTPAS
ncbi:hypothetical protein ACFQO7_05485 [Catellatospora aurea]|uniref:Uncharacterized protein n=1 Tax=Catellatospora aurea TaxID=1337874 RepID=A0ABW2GSC8_9ACTN